MEEQLKLSLSQAIQEFNNKRSAILQLAYTSGGQASVSKIEEEYDALRDAYYEILKKQLDKNNHLYQKLIDAANSETENLKEKIDRLDSINDIINTATAVVNLVGRILIVLGI